MILYGDNTGVMELVNNWSVGGRTRHVATKTMFLRELKECGWLVIEYKPGSLMRTDPMTKNLPKPLFETHSSYFVTNDEFAEEAEPQRRGRVLESKM